MRSIVSSSAHRKSKTTDISLRGPPKVPTRSLARGGAKRLKLRAREHARLQCHNLELDIMNLRQEIATLETTRRLLFARTLNRADASALGSFERIIREFYALSHVGYYKVVWRKHATSEPVDMVRFMRACFDDSLAFGKDAPMTPGGLNTFLTAMEGMVAVLDSPDIRLLSAKVRANEAEGTATVSVAVRCASSLKATLVDRLFPHLSAYFPSLRAKLIGQLMVTMSEGDFTFSTQHGRVVRVDLRMDQVQSITKLAESMEELHILEGKYTPRSPAIADVDDNEPTRGLFSRGSYDAVKDRTSELEHRFEDLSDRESPRSSASLSPMSLQHVLSPERGDDDNQSETDDDHADVVKSSYDRYEHVERRS